MLSTAASRDTPASLPSLPAAQRERFKPYNFSKEISFSSLVANLFKLIANQVISLGNYIDRKFAKVEEPAEPEKKVETAAAKVLTPTTPAEEAPAPKKMEPKGALRRYINDILPSKDQSIALAKKGCERPTFKTFKDSGGQVFNPLEIMSKKAWDTILSIIIEKAWEQTPDAKTSQPNEKFQQSIKNLIKCNFSKNDYEYFHQLYLHSLAPEHEKKQVEMVDASATKLGYITSASHLLLFYFTSGLSTHSIESFLNSLEIPYLDISTFLVLWGLTFYHIGSQLGIKRPSIDQIKETMKSLFSKKPKEHLKAIAQSFTGANLFKVAFTGVCGYLDRYYGSSLRLVTSAASGIYKSRCIKTPKDLDGRFEHKSSEALARGNRVGLALKAVPLALSGTVGALYTTAAMVSTVYSSIGNLFSYGAAYLTSSYS